MGFITSGRYASVASTAALIIALGGTSYAAVALTGADIKNNTVTTKDVKNATLGFKDLNSDVIATVRRPGPRGSQGLPGATGARGSQGATGLQGLQGPAGADGGSIIYVDRVIASPPGTTDYKAAAVCPTGSTPVSIFVPPQSPVEGSPSYSPTGMTVDLARNAIIVRQVSGNLPVQLVCFAR